MKKFIALCCWMALTGSAFALEPAPEPAQTQCPVSGKPVDSAFFADVDGFRIYAAGQAEAEIISASPKFAFAALAANGEAAIPTEMVCPSMGFAVGLNFPYVQREGKRIYYCCSPCATTIKADFAAAADAVRHNASPSPTELAAARKAKPRA